MEKPYKYFVLWRDAKGKLKQYDTDDEAKATAVLAAVHDGEVYIDTRYEARLRLYNRVQRKLK